MDGLKLDVGVYMKALEVQEMLLWTEFNKT